MAEKIRPVFIYLAFIAIILGGIGTLMLSGNITGLTIEDQEIYSLNEVSEHNTGGDCWIVSDGKVYDITLFLQVYTEDLSEKCGENINADNEMKKALQQYEIGILE